VIYVQLLRLARLRTNNRLIPSTTSMPENWRFSLRENTKISEEIPRRFL
jgi:hypothetical protein